MPTSWCSTTGANAITNEAGATLEAKSGATLEIESNVNNNSGGQLTTNGGNIIFKGSLLDNSGVITIGAGTTLSVSGALTNEASGQITVTGTLIETGSSAILNSGTIALNNGTLTDTAGITITGTLTGAGIVTAGTTAATDVEGTGSIIASGGTLEFKTQVDGNGAAATSFTIASTAGSVLKFDAAVGTASVHPTITFSGGDNGKGVLDLTPITLSNFHGVLAGFDEGESIKVTNAVSAALSSDGKVLTVRDANNLSLGTLTFTLHTPATPLT